MNYQQSYPGVWLGPAVPSLPTAEPWDQEDFEAELAKQDQRDEEAAIDMARDVRNGLYDD
jgi:hypothetical protein